MTPWRLSSDLPVFVYFHIKSLQAEFGLIKSRVFCSHKFTALFSKTKNKTKIFTVALKRHNTNWWGSQLLLVGFFSWIIAFKLGLKWCRRCCDAFRNRWCRCSACDSNMHNSVSRDVQLFTWCGECLKSCGEAVEVTDTNTWNVISLKPGGNTWNYSGLMGNLL